MNCVVCGSKYNVEYGVYNGVVYRIKENETTSEFINTNSIIHMASEESKPLCKFLDYIYCEECFKENVEDKNIVYSNRLQDIYDFSERAPSDFIGFSVKEMIEDLKNDGIDICYDEENDDEEELILKWLMLGSKNDVYEKLKN